MFQPPGKERLWINSHGALTMASNLAPLDSSIDFAYPASVATMLAAGPTIQQHVSFRPKMHSSSTLLKTVAG